MKSIIIPDELHEELTKKLGEYQSQIGKRVYMSDLVLEMIKQFKIKK